MALCGIPPAVTEASFTPISCAISGVTSPSLKDNDM